RASGPDWVMLPHAAYFFDALFSAGIAHSMVGIQRLARILERGIGSDDLAAKLAGYERALFREVEFLDWLIHGCYRTFGRCELRNACRMDYVGGAETSEKRRRRGVDVAEEGFLFSHHPRFRAGVKGGYEALLGLEDEHAPTPQFVESFHRRVALDIAPFN